MTYLVSPMHRRARGQPLHRGIVRVPRLRVVIRFQQGASPEKIAQSFPTLKLSQVYGAIARAQSSGSGSLLREYEATLTTGKE
jgi:uncharacterized protein (DUF433 family)